MMVVNVIRYVKKIFLSFTSYYANELKCPLTTTSTRDTYDYVMYHFSFRQTQSSYCFPFHEHKHNIGCHLFLNCTVLQGCLCQNLTCLCC